MCALVLEWRLERRREEMTQSISWRGEDGASRAFIEELIWTYASHGSIRQIEKQECYADRTKEAPETKENQCPVAEARSSAHRFRF